jgi:GT2 family glycosyltransferase
MSDTLVGIVTFGNVEFTQLTVRSIRETTRTPVDFYIIVGKPDDVQTISWLQSEPDIKFKVHDRNMGFPYSLNDVYDYAWKANNYKYLIVAGNDIIAYPNCIDSLIKLAYTSDYECISSLQYDVKDLIGEHPEVSHYFMGGNLLFTDFSSRPWELFTAYNNDEAICDMQLFDIQNCCLYKKGVFEKIGYTDVAFFPAYFIDNDYARRIVISGLKCCTLASARFFHFWSRTIHQGIGGTTDKQFNANKQYYRSKWGGDFGSETGTPPVYIGDRDLEEQIIDHWRSA